jgi:NAD(P)-dependent dehydrogenase (short-subunit alcohol dehydrogenase family)
MMAVAAASAPRSSSTSAPSAPASPSGTSTARPRRQCLKRQLLPEDIARVVLFFAADDSGACTSQSYVVDGGWV